MLTRDNLKKAIDMGLPGADAQWEMASSDRHVKGFPRSPRADSKDAAVLIILYPSGGSINTVFIRRPGYAGVHGGQISFPGGKKESSDKSLEHTALRETLEETGIDPGNVVIAGRLTPLYIPVSNYYVTPFVGWSEKKPEFLPGKSEVDYIIEADISVFLDGSIIKNGLSDIRGEKTEIRYFDYNGNIIWGATAMIFNEFLEIIRRTGIKVTG